MRGWCTALMLVVGCGGSVAAPGASAPVDGGAAPAPNAPYAGCTSGVIASLPIGLHSLAVDDRHVYFTAVAPWGGVFRAPLRGDGAERLFDGTGAVAVDTQFVYYAPCTTHPPKLMRWTRTGTPEEWTTSCAYALVETVAYLFAGEQWTSGGAPPPVSGSEIVRIDKRTAERVSLVTIGGDFAADADYVYFDNRVQARRLPVAGGAPERMGDAAPDHFIESMAVENGQLYVAEWSGVRFRIERFSAGDPPALIVDDLVAPRGSCLGVSDGKVYFGANDALMYTSTAGGPASMLEASGPCRGIAFDATSVYWSTEDSAGNNGAIRRACKP